MKNLSDLINGLVEKKMQIEQYKKDHPEQSEIVQMVEDYTALFDEVCRQSQVPVQPIVYPVIWQYYNTLQPAYPYKAICTDHTTMLRIEA